MKTPPPSVLGGVAAALTTGLVMALARALGQVRTLPERLLEWMLLFVPVDVFEAGIRRFGFDAKRYALYLVVLVMLAALAGLGAAALRRGSSPQQLLGVGLGLWWRGTRRASLIRSSGARRAGCARGGGGGTSGPGREVG